MRALRAALAGIVVVAALLGVARTQWPRFQCNREKRAVEGLLENLQTIVSDYQPAARMERCVAETPGDWQVHFLLASLQAAGDRKEAALQSYRNSLAVEERPETYHAISVIHFENGRMDEALANAEKAVIFSAAFAEQYAEPLRHTLYEKLDQRRARLREQQKAR
jgi:tetratricopeptide (TPR) repeat protein